VENAINSREGLPLPNDVQQAQSQKLASHMAGLAAKGDGFLTFEEFMQEALYAPGLGYYSAGAAKLGAAGDFVTAPELSPLFGHALANQLIQVTEATKPRILELGAGSGRLALEILRAYRDSGAELPNYQILEVSADLASRQRALFASDAPDLLANITWLHALPDNIEGAVIANEVLDAIPCRLAERDETGWRECGVGFSDSNELEWRTRNANADFLALLLNVLPGGMNFAPGYRAEFNPQAQALVGTLASRLSHGAAFMIDYGFPAREFYHEDRKTGTLMAHYRHRAHSDLFAWPGLQDLTSHVDFSALAHAADDADATLYGYCSQASFLLNCGILGLMDATLSTVASAKMTAGCQRLLSEAEMGELFKVLAFGRGIEEPFMGFSRGDRLHTL
jgi:SAM-dependent MidA family methyltransferase